MKRESQDLPDLVDIIASVLPMSDFRAARADSAVPSAAGSSGLGSALVGLCIDDAHPTLAGRVRVRIAGETEDAGAPGAREIWVATLAHLPVRREDRVLLLQPANWLEPIVVGVIDGMRARSAPSSTAATLTLKADEAVEIHGPDGAPLLSIVPQPGGPVLRLARADQRLEVDGRLAFAADAIEFTARGEVALSAGGDVVVNGEEIKLN